MLSQYPDSELNRQVSFFVGKYYFEQGRSKQAVKYFKKTLDETDKYTQFHAIAKIGYARSTEAVGDAMDAIDLYLEYLDYVEEIKESGIPLKLESQETMELLATALYTVAGDDYLDILDGIFEEIGPRPYQVDLYLAFVSPFKRDVRNDLVLQMYQLYRSVSRCILVIQIYKTSLPISP